MQDAGVSGAARPEDRPGFSRIIQLAEQKAFSILLVWKFDRLARNLAYAVTTVNQLQDMSIALRSVTEPIDTSSPMGQTIFAVLAGMAAQERLTITQRTIAGKKEKASRGGFAGGPASLGYARDKDGGFQVVAEEAETVRRIYTLRKQGLKLQEIADILYAEGVLTKRGGRWYPGTVRYILDNPKYQGYVEYYFRRDGEQYVIKESQHQAILPKVSKPVKENGASRTRHGAGGFPFYPVSIPASVGAADTGENGSWINEITPAGAGPITG